MAVWGVFGVELADEILVGAVSVGSALQAADAAALVARDLEVGGGQDGAGLLHLAVGVSLALEGTEACLERNICVISRKGKSFI